jgi:DNA-directed RNA polymerase subunit beta'
MPSFSPDDQFEQLKHGLEGTLKDVFDFEGRRSKLTLHGIEIRDDKTSEDLRSQRDAMRKGKTWSVPVYGDVSLQRGGKQVDRKKVLLMHLPKTTDRFGYIVDGNEYQVFNQFRLKSGVYHRIAPNGSALAEFNLANPDQFANGKSFKVKFDPAKAEFFLFHRNSNVPLYPLLKELGVGDRELEKAWGKEILEKNKAKATRTKAMKAFVRAVTGTSPKTITDEHTKLLRDSFTKTQLLEETTKKTLGKGYKTVTPDLLTNSTKQLLELSRGNRRGDDKNSLEFQSMHSVEDLMGDQIRRNLWKIRRKVQNNIDKKRSVRGIVPTDTFDRVVRSFFSTSLVTQGEQTNPLEMVSGARKTTIMGELGGTQSSYAITDEAKLINPSHLGFLDPIHTPEGEKTGVSLALPLGASKKGKEIYTHFRDAKTGRKKAVSPGDALKATVAFPDQYDVKRGKLVPRGKRIRATRNGEMVTVKPGQVDLVLPSPRSLFGISSNLIPFLQNNQGNRAMTAARQQEQAVPLLEREVPLVQAKTDTNASFEELLGGLSARRAPVNGVVDSVKKDAVIIRGPRGKKHEIQFYRDFALKGNSLYDSEVKVKAGDKVKKGQLLVDSTFTKDGTLALGTNLRAAYLPFFGYNFDDGIVISDRAAKKLTSLHVHQQETEHDTDTRINKSQFLSQYPHVFGKEQLGNVEDNGVVRIGSQVKQGDPLVLAIRKPEETQQRKQIHTFRRGRPDKWRNRAETWDKPYPGVVTDIVRRDGRVVVYVKTQEPAQVGDKLVGRHGNKGVITKIVPEAEMPYAEAKDGEKRHIDIALNPLGVPGRINLGQVLETAAGKIADFRGSPVKIRNFEPGKNYLESVKSDLKALGLEDKETLIDPRTGRPLKQKVMAGHQYIFKLKHQATKKLSARSGSGGGATPYDINHAPAGGSPHGGQSMGELGMYSLLSHGARDNLWEMYAYKSNKNEELWDALREGTPLPPPKVPFAYNKFLGYMNGLRLNVKKEGNHLQLVPFTERQVQQLSAGEIKEPGLVVRGKDLRPLKNGLFDEKITGGVEGTNWSHFTLPEPIPNPLFEEAVKKLTGLTDRKYRGIVNGNTEVDGKRGGAAINAMLEKIDVQKELKATRAKLEKSRGAGRDKHHKRLKILKALDEQKLKPTVYMMQSVPVLPPVFRPVSMKDDGSISNDDINGLYKDLGSLIEGYKASKKAGVPDFLLNDQRADIYDGVKAMTGMGGSLTREYRGIIDTIAGKTRTRGGGSRGASKGGFFQRHVMKRRQDYTGRSIITPEPKQGLDELGLPEDIAWKMYRPFVQQELSRRGFHHLDAIDEIDKKSPSALHALERAAAERPVLLKRDPALHKFNVMAFKPRLVKGKAIEVHPLITGGFNADFDGDTMSVYLPVTEKAVKESAKLFPSNNLFSPTTGAVMYTPGHEALLGTYLLSQPGKKTSKRFKTKDAAKSAMRRGEVEKTDIIRVGGHETTVGRLLIEEVLPPGLRETGKKKVKDMTVFDSRKTKGLLEFIAKNHSKETYGRVANTFKDLGNEFSTEIGFSIGLDDFDVIGRDKRDKLLEAAERKADKVRTSRLSDRKKKEKIVKIFSEADLELDKFNNAFINKNPTNISTMVDSGSRGSRTQLNQIVSTPTLVLNPKSEVVPFLIPKSYSEGMDVASYWTTLHGARKGTVQKTQGVREPGYLSKLIINSQMNQLVTENDCGTREGVDMKVDDFDVLDRYLTKGVKLGKRRYRAGTLVTPELISSARKSRRGSLPVRSPMRCKAKNGICKKCLGLNEEGRTYDSGTNIGVIAAQSIGEPSTQLSLNVFHTGGLAKGRGAKSAGTFERLNQLLKMPQSLPNKAPLALESGRISKIEKAPQGGEYMYVGDSRHYVPENQMRAFKRGDKVSRGDALTIDGLVDPKQLLPLKGIRAVQDYLADEIHDVLGTAAPIKKRNVEVVVRSMTNVTRVDDSGDHPDWVPGDVRPASNVLHWNRSRASRGKKPVRHTPVLKGIDVLPKELQEDWIARMNFQDLNRTLAQAAREGWRSNIHGFHPVPGLAQATEFGRGKGKVPTWEGQY